MKKFISCLLTFVLILSLMAPLSLCVSAEVTALSQDSDGYYLINNEEELWFFQNNFATFASANIKLVNDITITSEDQWTPSTTAFTGIFDGQGHTISGLTRTSGFGNNFGFFSQTGTATIKNLKLVLSKWINNSPLGALVGYQASGTLTIDNVHVTANSGFYQSQNKATGGLVGAVNSSCTTQITNSSFNGAITGAGKPVGGLVGNTYSALTVQNCSVNGSITSSAANIAGIIGFAQNGALKIENTDVNMNITSNGSLTGASGGLIGQAHSVASVTVDKVSYNGTISATGEGIGAIIGWNNPSGATTISNVFVSGESISAYRAAGGVIGYQAAGTGVAISNAYVSTTAITATNSSTRPGVGGLIGNSQVDATLTDCVVTTDITGNTNNGGLIGTIANKSVTATRCVFTGSLNENGSGAATGALIGDATNATLIECVTIATLYAAGAEYTTLPVVNSVSGTLSVTDCYYDSTKTAALTNATDIKDLPLNSANGAKNLSALFDEDSCANWTITDSCPMPTAALKGCNVANLEMLAFQTKPEQPVTGEYDIRFVGFINSTDYKEAGVIVKIGDKEAKLAATHVYNSINEKLGDTTASSDITDYGYQTGDGHFLAIVLKGVPASVTEFTVTPYVVTNDDITVYGVSGTAAVTVATVTE
ncbi:MAG: hypothetical protein IJW55_10080 [Clostridia bacterium]|nr:hypothetical protein [Clostridia bacterium]MBQ7348295.1 hypothetical protein [Clostridia bacterium]